MADVGFPTAGDGKNSFFAFSATAFMEKEAEEHKANSDGLSGKRCGLKLKGKQFELTEEASKAVEEFVNTEIGDPMSREKVLRGIKNTGLKLRERGGGLDDVNIFSYTVTVRVPEAQESDSEEEKDGPQKLPPPTDT
mmetsp:Transcript_104530/g.207591  ORF Transcript_104530/g.207591 Transcript_104530/m.207591 type:complete len:137 (+) Transcript_104530:78-488(+)